METNHLRKQSPGNRRSNIFQRKQKVYQCRITSAADVDQTRGQQVQQLVISTRLVISTILRWESNNIFWHWKIKMNII